MKKLTILAIVLVLLKLYYNSECVYRDYDYSRFTYRGVYCYSQDKIFHPYKPLRDIDIFIPVPDNQEKIRIL